jgi:hypothetical protein
LPEPRARDRRPPRERGGRAGARPRAAIIACAACVALTLWVHRRALGAYFSPDDLISFERVRGLLPPHPLPFWRLLSGPVYFALALRVFGTNPVPYHLLNWLLHGLNVALLFGLARRWGASTAGAAVAAATFGASRLLEVVLLQAVGVGELLSLTGALGMFLALDANRPRRVLLASLGFGATLLCKEGVLLLPLLVLLPLPPRAPIGARARATAALLGVSGVFLAAFALAHGRATALGGDAYATAFGLNVFHNLMTYGAWMVNVSRLVPDLPAIVDFQAWRTGLFVMVVLVGATVLRRSSASVAGLLWFLLALAPVLPLLHHSYLQYAYAAFAGVAIVLGTGWDGMAAWLDRVLAMRRPRASGPGRAAWVRRVVPAALGLLLVGYAAAADAMIARRWERRIPGLDLHYDPSLRKSELVRHVAETLGPTIAGRRVKAVFILPVESQLRLQVTTGQAPADASPPAPELLVSVLDQGRAMRALFPNLDTLAFVNRWTPGFQDFDIIVNTPDGFTRNYGQGPDAHLKLVAALLDGGYDRVALEHVVMARSVYPDEPRLMLAYARVLARNRRATQARAVAAAIMSRFPTDPVAADAAGFARELATSGR